MPQEAVIPVALAGLSLLITLLAIGCLGLNQDIRELQARVKLLDGKD